MSEFFSPESGYVYVVRFGSLYKIGMSTVPNKRVYLVNPRTHKKIFADHPDLNSKRTILLIKYVANMRSAERAIHAHFASKQAGAEWFRLQTEDVDWIKDYKEHFEPLPPLPPLLEKEIIRYIQENDTTIAVWDTVNAKQHLWRGGVEHSLCGLYPHGAVPQFFDRLLDIPMCLRCASAVDKSIRLKGLA